ncbi:MAG: hypothetical protein NVSMB42_01370 [Herpetosiphon sp.]
MWRADGLQDTHSQVVDKVAGGLQINQIKVFFCNTQCGLDDIDLVVGSLYDPPKGPTCYMFHMITAG